MRVIMVAVMLVLTSCAGFVTTVNTQDFLNGEDVDKAFEKFSIFPTIPQSVLKKLSPEQLTAILTAQAQALVGINDLHVEIKFSQRQGTEGQAEGTVTPTVDVDGIPLVK